MVERVATGIPGFDELIEGGFPKDNVILVSGSPGTCKTILALQFLINGAKNGERGLYITFEENADAIRIQANEFGWGVKHLEDSNMMRILNLKTLHSNVEKIVLEIEELVKKFQPKRIVLDSLSTLAVYAEVIADMETFEMMGMKQEAFIPPVLGEAVTRRAIMSLIERLRALRVTCILTSELQEGSNWYSRDTVSEFACDGIIKLSKIEAMGKRTLTVEKMRSTKHDFLARTLSISDKGLKVESR